MGHETHGIRYTHGHLVRQHSVTCQEFESRHDSVTVPPRQQLPNPSYVV